MDQNTEENENIALLTMLKEKQWSVNITAAVRTTFWVDGEKIL